MGDHHEPPSRLELYVIWTMIALTMGLVGYTIKVQEAQARPSSWTHATAQQTSIASSQCLPAHASMATPTASWWWITFTCCRCRVVITALG